MDHWIIGLSACGGPDAHSLLPEVTKMRRRAKSLPRPCPLLLFLGWLPLPQGYGQMEILVRLDQGGTVASASSRPHGSCFSSPASLAAVPAVALAAGEGPQAGLALSRYSEGGGGGSPCQQLGPLRRGLRVMPASVLCPLSPPFLAPQQMPLKSSLRGMLKGRHWRARPWRNLLGRPRKVRWRGGG